MIKRKTVTSQFRCRTRRSTSEVVIIAPVNFLAFNTLTTTWYQTSIFLITFGLIITVLLVLFFRTAPRNCYFC